MFSKDGKFLYLMYEIKNVIDVYTYETGDRVPKIEKIQTIPSTAPERTSQLTAACTIRMSEDETHLFCSNAGDNSVSVYERDAQTGLLKLLCCLPISGDYPKVLRFSRMETIWRRSTTAVTAFLSSRWNIRRNCW